MVYHLKNWEFIRDWMCSNPDWIADAIADILQRDIGMPMSESNRKEIKSTVRDCGCVGTLEGLESCLNASREDFSPAFRGKPGESPQFEKLLETLDKWAEDTKIGSVAFKGLSPNFAPIVGWRDFFRLFFTKFQGV